MARTRERVRRIDEFLIENYPSTSTDYCAEFLDEPVYYIRRRVGYLKLKKDKAKSRKTDGKPIEEDIQISVLKDRIKDLEEMNRELRKELIKFTHIKMQQEKVW